MPGLRWFKTVGLNVLFCRKFLWELSIQSRPSQVASYVRYDLGGWRRRRLGGTPREMLPCAQESGLPN